MRLNKAGQGLEIQALLDERLGPRAIEKLVHCWPLWARDAQSPPKGDWRSWLIMGGRGSGKTRAGAEWVRGLALGTGFHTGPPQSPIALIGRDYDEARAVMIEGHSGLLAIHAKAERPAWTPSRRRLEWPNGAVAQVFSAESFEALRGPQFAAAWCDEVAKWRFAQEAFDQLQFALRLGPHPRQCLTTTPRGTAFMRALVARDNLVLSPMRTADNADNLARGFVEEITARYQGTRLGRQELDGELIADREDALFRRADIERARIGQAPLLARIVVAIDPPASSGPRADSCGIVAAGRTSDGRFAVLADATIAQARPDQWARRAIALYRRLSADRIVAEVNQGGEMVSSILRGIDPDLPVRSVRATRGKWLRAEPIAALYEQGRVSHVGAFPELEDELADFGPDGLSDGQSPDRLDALVWALTALTRDNKPSVRPV